jgi:hypothetical protein
VLKKKLIQPLLSNYWLIMSLSTERLTPSTVNSSASLQHDADKSVDPMVKPNNLDSCITLQSERRLQYIRASLNECGSWADKTVRIISGYAEDSLVDLAPALPDFISKDAKRWQAYTRVIQEDYLERREFNIKWLRDGHFFSQKCEAYSQILFLLLAMSSEKVSYEKDSCTLSLVLGGTEVRVTPHRHNCEGSDHFNETLRAYNHTFLVIKADKQEWIVDSAWKQLASRKTASCPPGVKYDVNDPYNERLLYDLPNILIAKREGVFQLFASLSELAGSKEILENAHYWKECSSPASGISFLELYEKTAKKKAAGYNGLGFFGGFFGGFQEKFWDKKWEQFCQATGNRTKSPMEFCSQFSLLEG